MTRSAAATLVTILAFWGSANAQNPSSAVPAFEAASVKVGDAFVAGVSGMMKGGPGTADSTRIAYTRVLMRNLLVRAYGMKSDQISGPPWLDEVIGDKAVFVTINATMAPGITPEQFQLMLQNLLIERFHLAVHHSTKDFPGYELVVVPGGPRLKEAAAEDVPDGPVRLAGGMQHDANGFPVRRPGSPASSEIPRMGVWGMFRSSNRISMTQFVARMGAMVNESNGVEANANVPRVVDKTGLTGVYEFQLEFAGMFVNPPSLAANIAASKPPDGSASGPVATDPGEIGPSLFTALEKQLGLKLVKVKSVPVDMLVVDSVDKVPTEN